MTIEQIKNEVLKGNVDALYKSKQWQEKRKKIIERDHNECQRCKIVKHKYSKGNIVHHIVELRDDVELMLEDDNLETVCAKCHNELHPEKRIKYKRKRFNNIERW